ncbi:CU044_5270 family protein [Lentzea alba]|uniref:CU044_5270 family protein n=1 Tax=Lentzea alba TaxID=2714351 RepID=UPI0039BEF424
MSDEKRPVEDEMVKWAMSDVAPMSDEAFSRGKAALLARIDGEESGKVVPLAPRRRRRIPLVAAAAVTVLIAGAALIVPSLTSRESGPNVAAADLLIQAAGKVGDAKLEPGQYLYVLQQARWSNKDGNDYKWMFLTDHKFETWIPYDRSGTWLHRRTNVGDKQWLIGSEKDVPFSVKDLEREDGEWKIAGGRWFGDKVPVSFTDPTVEYIAKLPRDPRELYEKLKRESHGKNLVLMITSGLDTGVYPADVRSAVFKALSYAPGLEIVDTAAVLDGRTGTALGITDHGVTQQIVINPATGEYLGSRSVMAEDAWGLKKGQVIGITSLTTKVVSAMGAAA